MAKVNRSTYQKVVEENKRLLKDIKVLVNGTIPDKIPIMSKWRNHFNKEEQFNKLMKSYALKYMEDNPDNPIVKAVKELKSQT